MQTAATAAGKGAQSAVTLPGLCFTLAAATVVIGMCLGMYMGIVHDFTLAPVHAHLNLLGWVSLFMLGLFYRLHPQAISRLARFQAGSFIVGYITMLTGMAGMFLIGPDGFLPLAIIGGILLILSMIMFFTICWKLSAAA
jgi:hypothetical protein